MEAGIGTQRSSRSRVVRMACPRKRARSKSVERGGPAVIVAVLLALLMQGGCSESTAPPDPGPPENSDRVLVVTTDYATGSVADLQAAPPWTPRTDLAPVCPDAVARVEGGLIYVVNRFGCDNVEVIDPGATWDVVREFSVGSGTNPQDIALVSPTRAYVSRYETNELLEIDPSTGSQLGTISLAEFADSLDGLCEMHRMIVRGGDLFVEVQRLDRTQVPWVPVPPSILVVIDLGTREVVDTDPDSPGLQGIPLAGTNPAAPMQFDPSTGDLLVPTAGVYGVVDAGGIERVDPESGRSEGFIVTEAALGGDIVDFALWTERRGYAIISDPQFQTSLVAFDPSSGTLIGTVYAPGGYVLADCLVHPAGFLFVADRDFYEPGVRVFDATDGTPTAGPLSTGLPPFELVILPAPEEDIG